jgi:hypothetical protein
LEKLAIPFTLAFRSPAHATTPRKRKDIGIDVTCGSQSQRLLGSPMFILMPLGLLGGAKWI